MLQRLRSKIYTIYVNHEFTRKEKSTTEGIKFNYVSLVQRELQNAAGRNHWLQDKLSDSACHDALCTDNKTSIKIYTVAKHVVRPNNVSAQHVWDNALGTHRCLVMVMHVHLSGRASNHGTASTTTTDVHVVPRHMFTCMWFTCSVSSRQACKRSGRGSGDIPVAIQQPQGRGRCRHRAVIMILDNSRRSTNSRSSPAACPCKHNYNTCTCRHPAHVHVSVVIPPSLQMELWR